MFHARPIAVGLADCRTCNDAGASLVTYALGSCVAVAIHDPVAKVGGILHLMLPDSSLDPEKARQKPFMFADTGIPLFFRRAFDAGAQKRRLIVYMAGGAQVLDADIFNLGERNCLAVRKVLWKAGVLIHGAAVGGVESRTLRLEVGSGHCLLRTASGRETLLGGEDLIPCNIPY